MKKDHCQLQLLHQLITCIAKAEKPRFLKSWRPISLLCGLCKLLSTIIASRLKLLLIELYQHPKVDSFRVSI